MSLSVKLDQLHIAQKLTIINDNKHIDWNSQEHQAVILKIICLYSFLVLSFWVCSFNNQGYFRNNRC